MNKQLMNEIKNLESDEQIEKFVKERLIFLENDIEEKTIGQGYTDVSREYIGKKTHYKAIGSTEKFNCPDLIYDDIRPYVEIVKSIKNKSMNGVDLFSEIFYIINDFSKIEDSDLMARNLTYFFAMQSKRNISIKEMFANNAMFCSERSGLSQNMFKFLGIDSELVIGYRDSEPHAYNIVFPMGYDKEPLYLFDSSHFISFCSDNKKYSLAYFFILNKDEYDGLLKGKSHIGNMIKIENYYRKRFNFDENYKFKCDTPIYKVGLKDNPNVVNKISIEDYMYLSHYENGVETVIKK